MSRPGCLVLALCLVWLPTLGLAGLPPGEMTPEGRWTCKIQFKSRPGQKKLTIDMVIQKALAQNPGIKEALAAVGMAEGGRVTAGLIPNPSLVGVFLNLNRDVSSHTYQLLQTIETGGKRAKRVRVADCDVAAARFELDNRVRLVVGLARRGFIRVLQALSDTECAERTLRSFDDLSGGGLSSAEKEGGPALRVANERLDLQNELERAVLAVEVVKHDLSELLGEPAIWDESDVDGGMYYISTDLQLEQLRKTAFANRPDWKLANVLVDQATSRLKLTKAQRAWNVNVGPAVTHVDGNSDLGVGLVVSTQPQLFDRFQGEIAKDKKNIERIDANRRRVELAIERELRTLFDRYRVVKKIVQSYRDRYLKDSVLALNTSQAAYQKRSISATDYLDTLRTYRRIQIGYRGALAEYMLALSDVDVACAAEVVRLEPVLTLGNDAEDGLYYSPTYLSGGPK
ncbi:MAG: TolC family protein [Candidatus Riflebacteria bacterium]|nr:TolC family protein [Candidatus Riflebacteria bacterium]